MIVQAQDLKAGDVVRVDGKQYTVKVVKDYWIPGFTEIHWEYTPKGGYYGVQALDNQYCCASDKGIRLVGRFH